MVRSGGSLSQQCYVRGLCITIQNLSARIVKGRRLNHLLVLQYSYIISLLEQAERGRTDGTTGGAFGRCKCVGCIWCATIHEYDTLSNGGIHTSESPGKSVFQHSCSSCKVHVELPARSMGKGKGKKLLPSTALSTSFPSVTDLASIK